MRAVQVQIVKDSKQGKDADEFCDQRDSVVEWNNSSIETHVERDLGANERERAPFLQTQEKGEPYPQKSIELRGFPTGAKLLVKAQS